MAPTRVFLYGTLLDAATLAGSSGDATLPARCVPATLLGWQRVALQGGRYPTLRRRRSGSVRGVVVAVSARALARLAAYERPAYRLTRVVVQTAKRKTAVHTWIAAAATRRPWKE
ncbi:MAG TPA: gamma-glutamylcyclotransferase family protein [Acetobacteraceae bacterium]|nr:gamma-glutamylcyclotransferase family protein [Acetobacteraceae bacterium]